MNKKLTLASALLAATSAFAFITWNADSDKVLTEIGNDTETAGYWFSYGDDGDGGASSVTWPVPLGNEYSPDAMDPVIAECGGICGTAVLAKGTLTYNPFVGIGFNVVGETSADDKTPAAGNASAWGGLCITYTAAAGPNLELGLGDAVDATIGYANPNVALAKASAPTTKKMAWADFKQPAWYKEATKMSGTDAAAQLVAVKFKIQAVPGSYEFNIKSIGPFDGKCGEGNAIKAVRGASAAKAILSGRTLSFAGVNTVATAEVLNLQGQVVAKGSAASALNLASLDAGVYMVRVAGKSVNFTNKIVLK